MRLPDATTPTSLSSSPVGLPGIGPRTAEKLAAAGVHTRADLLDLIPRRWDDLRSLTPIRHLQPGAVQIACGEVTSSRFLFGRRRSLEVRLRGDDGTGKLVARWFVARSSMKERFAPGTRWLLTGMVREHRGELVMAHPESQALDGEEQGAGTGVRARYPEIEGVAEKVIAQAARRVASEHADEVVDGLPAPVLAARGWPRRGAALALLHAVAAEGQVPSADEVALLNAGAHPAQQRLIYDELFFLQLGLARRRARIVRQSAPRCAPLLPPSLPSSPPSPSSLPSPPSLPSLASVPPPEPALWRPLAAFLAALPFSPTEGQRRAVREIAVDLGRAHPMHRLLQGDVGAGKTMVMYAAAELAMAAGFQVAVMAPTELLAEQHARTLSPWARATTRRMALLTASTGKAARAEVLTALATDDPAQRIDLVVGTHALLGEQVRFARLGLVIVDEQHRFGVAQRAALRERAVTTGGGAGMPHLLVMTATPIPRTLALTAWGDLDLTLLAELPPGRAPAETRLVVGARGRKQAYAALTRALGDGRQGFVVCPRVEATGELDDGATIDDPDDPDRDAGSAIATCERLRRELPGTAIGLVHGRVPAAERDATMRAFATGSLQLLVATTVIEVGVDVPAADVMLVEGAERFGLAQLHQLRGRIGRAPRLDGVSGPAGAGSPRAPLFVMICGAPADSDAARRLAVLVDTRDGFAIAEADLATRGPGELFGTRQSGLPRLRFADLRRDLELLRAARTDAFATLEGDPDLARPEHAVTLSVLADRWREDEVFAEEAG